MKKKILISTASASAAILLSTVSVFAHVVVKPDTVGIGAFQTYVMGVPNEKDNPVNSIKLTIPEGLKEVSPNVKPGWSINITKNGDAVTEVSWSGGNIPVGQRDDFYFSAQAPAQEGELDWKVTQNYENGTIVTWDQTPGKNKSADDDSETTGPYSITRVVNDLNPKEAISSASIDKTSQYTSWIALALGAAALVLALQNRSSKKRVNN